MKKYLFTDARSTPSKFACLALAMSLLLLNTASAQSPCAAKAAYRLAQLKANQSELNLQNHLANKPADADPAWQNSLNQLGVKKYELDQALKAAEKNVLIANNDLATRRGQTENAKQQLATLQTARAALEQEIQTQKAVWNTPAAGLVRDYDTWFAKVTAVVDCEDLHGARTKIRDASFMQFKDERINKLRRDIEYFEQRPTEQNAQKRLAEMRPLLQAHLDALTASVDEAEKVKRELLDKHQLYPFSAEANSARAADTVVSGGQAKLDAAKLQIDTAKSAAEQLQLEVVKLTADVTKAQAAVTQAKQNQMLGLTDLDRLQNTLETKIDENSKSMTRWHQNRMDLEKAQTVALDEMQKSKELCDTAIEAAKTFTAGVYQRWSAFKSTVVEKFNATKQQIADATSDEDKDAIRAAAQPWFQNASQLVPKFTAELEGSPYTGLCEECQGVRQLIADTKAFNGQIDAIVATLAAKIKHEAIDLSGQWTCTCNGGTPWAITKLGDNSASGARYAVVISSGEWAARLAGSYNAKTRVLTVAGQDTNKHDITVVLTYDTHNGHLVGTYLNRTVGKTDAEDVHRGNL